MPSYIPVCILFALSLASVNGKVDIGLKRNVPEMSDREMMEFMMTRISRLETENMRQEKRIEILENTVLRQNEVIKSLQKVQEENGLFNDSSAKTDSVIHPDHVASGDQTIRQQSKRDKPTRHRDDGRKRRQLSGASVAFSSQLTSSLIHLGAHQDIVFDKTLVNTNNVYNPNHGVFTVPVPGVYVITGTVLAYNNREVWCDIVVNGASMAKIYARGTDNRHDQGTQTILLNLKQGDDVAIQNEAVDDAVYGEQAGYTTFSGFLLYEAEEAIVG